jgi:hypothetical protein
MLESVAIMGPLRFGVPLTQAASAPLVGRLQARGVPVPVQVLLCGVIRLVHTSATTAFLIWVIVGGLGPYAATYEALAGRLPWAPRGVGGALALTGAALLAWAVFASTVQVLVYRRGLSRWPTEHRAPEAPIADSLDEAGARRFDPRAVVLAAALGFGALLVNVDWAMMAAVAGWLGVAWVTARPDRETVPSGLLLTLVLGGGVFGVTILGGAGLELAALRGVRAALLVLVATWLRAAAGAPGLREVARRSLRRLRRVPSIVEAGEVLDRLAAETRLLSAGRSLATALGAARKRPRAVVDAVLDWVASRSARGGARPPAERLTLSLRAVDALLLGLLAAALAAAVLMAA